MTAAESDQAPLLRSPSTSTLKSHTKATAADSESTAIRRKVVRESACKLKQGVPMRRTQHSSLPLQILLHFNALLFVPYIAITGIIVYTKLTRFELTAFHKFLSYALLGIFFIVEPIRLRWGYKGNLGEKVPFVAGHILFSVFPVSFICLFYAGAQNVVSGFTLPIEVALNAVYLIILIPQIFLSYQAAKGFVRALEVDFQMTLADSSESQKKPPSTASVLASAIVSSLKKSTSSLGLRKSESTKKSREFDALFRGTEEPAPSQRQPMAELPQNRKFDVLKSTEYL